MLLLCLASCTSGPQMVLVNQRTGATVGCQYPDFSASSGDFLISPARQCLSACQAHGFNPMPGLQAPGTSADIPDACLN